jgi:hypothetical protein
MSIYVVAFIDLTALLVLFALIRSRMEQVIRIEVKQQLEQHLETI